jgi:methyl-accepting chemotaxis protein
MEPLIPNPEGPISSSLARGVEIARRLKHRDRWLVVPSSLGQTVGAGIATYYGTLTIDFPPGSVPRFFVAAAVVVILLNVYGNWRVLGRMSTLRQIGLNKVPPTHAALAACLREVTSIPDYMFRLALENWVIGAGSVGLVMWLSGAGLELFLRIWFLGAMFGPLTSMLVMVLVTLRTREVVREISEGGLSASEVTAALPPKRLQIRARLAVFTAISVILPAVMTADVSTRLGDRIHQKVMQTPRERQREVAEEERLVALQKVLFLCALMLGLALVTASAVGSALGRPMREVAEEATRIARGELREVRVIPAEDEVWAVSSAFTSMQANLATVLGQLQRAGIRIGTTTEQIVETSDRYEQGASQQAASLNETSATTEELARSAAQIAGNASSVAEIAQRTLAAAEQGRGSAEDFAGSMGRMRQDNQAVASSVAKLSKRVQQIGKIVEFINGVADKSDLLALNAELEGTKAGEVGRNFSLVAAEMRRLAENVLESTKEIEGLIEEIRDATQAAVTATAAGVQATDGGAALSASVSDSLRTIVDLAGRTSDAVRAISLSTQQQQTGTDQLAEAMSDILRVTQQSMAATKQVAAANSELATLARDLKIVVQRFKIGV